jgi:drug/metabolite transporter (DMT)-like permease
MTGIVLSLLAAMGFGATAVFAKVGLQGMPTRYGTLISLAVSATAAMAIAAALHPGEIVELGAVSLAWLFLVGLFNFPVGRMFNYMSVRLAGVSKASTVVATSPLFATGLAVVILGESVNAVTLAGTALIIGGLALTLYEK